MVRDIKVDKRGTCRQTHRVQGDGTFRRQVWPFTEEGHQGNASFVPKDSHLFSLSGAIPFAQDEEDLGGVTWMTRTPLDIKII